jgi:hypothetical protein
MKHVGKMKNNGAKVVVVYRTLPGDPHSALVVGTSGLQASYHDALMSLVQDPSGQSANELADILSVRKFPDGNNMLSWLHFNNHLKKVPTTGVLMTPNTTTAVPLDEINKLIAESTGVSIEDLAVSDGTSTKPTEPKAKKEPVVVTDVENTTVQNDSADTPAQMRSRADALFKEAQRLRRAADEIDPPKSKKKAAEVQTE